MKKQILAIWILTLAAAPWVMAQDPFVKFHLTDSSENSETPTTVKLSLPLGLLEGLRPSIDDALNQIDIDGHDLDLRLIWQEVRNAGPNEYVEIREHGNRVIVSTNETHLIIDVEEEDETIKVTIPLALGDALLGRDIIDFDNLMDTLLSFRGQDLLTIQGDQIQARCWIE